jgi:hypothetical protein
MMAILVEEMASMDKLVKRTSVANLLVESSQRLEPDAAVGILTRALEKETDQGTYIFLAEGWWPWPGGWNPMRQFASCP